jgi:hypothetical protein
MPISQSPKLGTSVDTGDLLAQRKRNIENQVTQSKKALGIYKPSLYRRGFDLINLQMQNGLDSLLTSTPTVLNVNLLVADVALFHSPSGNWRSTSTITIPSGTTLTIKAGETLEAKVINNGQFVIEQDGTFTGSLTNTVLTTVTGTINFLFTTNTGTIQLLATASARLYVAALLNIGSFNLASGAEFIIDGTMFTYNGGSVSNRGSIDLRDYGQFNRSLNVCGVGTYTNPSGGALIGGTLTNACPPQTTFTPFLGFSAIDAQGTSTFVAYENSTWVIAGQNVGSTIDIYYGTLGNLVSANIFTGTNSTVAQVRYGNGGWGLIVTDDPNQDLAYGSSLTSLTKTQLFEDGGMPFFIIYENSTWVVGGANPVTGNNLYYGSTLANLSPVLIFGAGGSARSAKYANGTWVIGGLDNSGIGRNVYYGSDLGNLTTSLTIFGDRGSADSITYANNTWVICGDDVEGTNSVYYGADITSLDGASTFGVGGYAISATYGNGTWVICGIDDSGSGNNVYYGSDLAALTPKQLFSNEGSAREAVYAAGKWVIIGIDESGYGNNVYYGSDLTSLTSVNMFGHQANANSIKYADNTWVIAGSSKIGETVYYGNFP